MRSPRIRSGAPLNLKVPNTNNWQFNRLFPPRQSDIVSKVSASMLSNWSRAISSADGREYPAVTNPGRPLFAEARWADGEINAPMEHSIGVCNFKYGFLGC